MAPDDDGRRPVVQLAAPQSASPSAEPPAAELVPVTLPEGVVAMEGDVVTLQVEVDAFRAIQHLVGEVLDPDPSPSRRRQERRAPPIEGLKDLYRHAAALRAIAASYARVGAATRALTFRYIAVPGDCGERCSRAAAACSLNREGNHGAPRHGGIVPGTPPAPSRCLEAGRSTEPSVPPSLRGCPLGSRRTAGSVASGRASHGRNHRHYGGSEGVFEFGPSRGAASWFQVLTRGRSVPEVRDRRAEVPGTTRASRATGEFENTF